MVRVIYSVLLRALLHGCAFLTTVEEGAAPLISALQMLKKRAALRNSLSPDVTPACTLYVENFLFTWSNLVLSFCECHPPHTAHSIPGVLTYSQLLMQHLTEPAIYIQWELGDDKVNNLTQQEQINGDNLLLNLKATLSMACRMSAMFSGRM
jgi:hypothetical protein